MTSIIFLLLLCFTTYANAVDLFSCNFDVDLCGMTPETYIRQGTGALEPSWARATGYTPTGQLTEQGTQTGPTGPQAGQGYVHFEASFRTSDMAVNSIASPTIDGRFREDFSIRFYVSQHGAGLDTLIFRIKDATTSQVLYNTVVRNASAPGFVDMADWSLVTISLAGVDLNRQFYFEFEGSGKGQVSYNADWGIDTLVLQSSTERQCFENSDCTGANTMCDLSNNTCVCDPTYQPATNMGTRNLSCLNEECSASNPCTGGKICINVMGRSTCSCPTNSTENAGTCYLNGGYSDWMNQGNCTADCGGGTQQQIRQCNNPPPQQPFGMPCNSSEPTVRQNNCNPQTCGVGCPTNKTCECGMVDQFATGMEPKANLSNIDGLSLEDGNTVRAWVELWSGDYLNDQCKAAKCDMTMLDNLLANLTYYVNQTATFNTNYNSKKMMMRDYINCNKNVEIESNLWDTYDVLSDQCICIAQMYKDLKMKMDIIMNEKKRCEERGWYRSWLEMFSKSW